jgi:hypothetical protein
MHALAGKSKENKKARRLGRMVNARQQREVEPAAGGRER